MADKVAIITGASSGIGAATAHALVDAGFRVVLAARRLDRLQSLAAELNQRGRALVIPTDVVDSCQVQALIDQTIAHYGQLDVLVNNAGIMPLSFMRNGHLEEWLRMVDVNIKGPLNGIAAALPVFRNQGSGHIVNISSKAGRRIFPSGAVYCGTKFALNAISEGLRAELAMEGKRVRITLIEPGITTTELAQHITDCEVSQQPPPRPAPMELLRSEDIARAVVYAVSQPCWVNVAEVLVMPTDQP